MRSCISRFLLLLLACVIVGQDLGAQQRAPRRPNRIRSTRDTAEAPHRRPADWRRRQVAVQVTPIDRGTDTTGPTGPGGPMLAEQCGSEANPCLPKITVGVVAGYDTTVRLAETGPYTYKIKVTNGGTAEGDYEINCIDQSQVWCADGTASIFITIPAGSSANLWASYSVRGLGRFKQAYRGWVYPAGGDAPLGKSSSSAIVKVGGTPIVSHLTPGPGAIAVLGDSLAAIAGHPSGMVTSSYKAFLNGIDVSSSISARTATGYVIRNPNLTPNVKYTWTSYACANNGRCDSVSSVFEYQGPPTVWASDDELPTDDEVEQPASPMLGPLPLPPTNMRGCPTTTDSPEIRVGDPFSYLSQPAIDGGAGGLIFLASLQIGRTLTIGHLSVDHEPADGVTCTNMGPWLTPNQYNFAFWSATNTNDTLWAGYPYPDKGDQYSVVTPSWLPESRLLDPAGFGHGGTAAGRQRHPLLDHLGATLAPTAGRGPAVTPLIPDPRGIDTASYKLVINGVVFADRGYDRPGVVRHDFWRGGGQVDVPANDPALHHYDVDDPLADNGGWNEALVSIADTGGRVTTVRSRWVQVAQQLKPLALTPMRRFDRVDMGSCVANGPFQCGGVFAAQTIPGFTTRDRDRSLHLIYRSTSQPGRTTIPLQVDLPRTTWMPDKFQVRALEGGGDQTGDTLFFAGTSGNPLGSGGQNLDSLANERRVIVGELAPSGQVAKWREIDLSIGSYYADSGWRFSTYHTELPELVLRDTTMTRFGEGWQLAEDARLFRFLASGNRVIAVILTGDGSYTTWTKAGSVWSPSAGVVARLVEPAGGSDGAQYVLYGPGGSSQGFRTDGRLVWNRDLVGNATRFVYDANGRLTAITDPSGYKYAFSYNAAGATGRVGDIHVVTPAQDSTRIVTLRYAAGGRLAGFGLWRSDSVKDETAFEYASTLPDGAFLSSVIDPRSTASVPRITSFEYDPLTRSPLSGTRWDGYPFYHRDAFRRAAPRVGRGRSAGQPLERVIYPGQMRGQAILPGGQPTEFKVDPWGAATYVHLIAPQPIMHPDFSFTFRGSDVERHIVRDSVGHVLRIVSQRDSTAVTDSVMYQYDALGRVTRIIRPTAAYPVPAQFSLDTVRFTYDSLSLVSNGAWCSRLLTAIDPMGGTTSTAYGASGVKRCLPSSITGLAGEVTTFGYGPLTPGDVAGARPTRTTPPTGVSDSAVYNGPGWNTARVIRQGDGHTSSITYDSLFNRAATSTDPAGTVSVTCLDYSGRVLRTRTGLGPNVSATATTYDAANNVLQTQVFALPGEDLCTATLPAVVQTTRTFYDRMDQVDSVIGPGVRAGSNPAARKQSWRVRDAGGRPLWEFSGNGTYRTRIYDWAGRVTEMGLSPVDPSMGVDGERFADPATKSEYTNGTTFSLSFGGQLSGGQLYKYTYDTRGLLVGEVGRDNFLNTDSTYGRRRGYSRRGALVADSLAFRDGLLMVRRYEYDRRGARVTAADTVTIPGGTQLAFDRTSLTKYVYSATTGRLDSLNVTVDSAGGRIGVVAARFHYDRAGRDSVRRVWVGTDVLPIIRTQSYDNVGHQLLTSITRNSKTWYRDSRGTADYDLADRLVSTSTIIGTASSSINANYGFQYDAASGRLLRSDRSDGTITTTSIYEFDTFGNRTAMEFYSTEFGSACTGRQNYIYSTDGDNRLISFATPTLRTGCPINTRVLTDQAGNRLGEVNYDVNQPGWSLQKMTYTAANQLFFSLTTTGTIGTYDVNWHWYDASGLRIMSQRTTSNTWQGSFSPTSGVRSYYMYDGSDVALVVNRTGPSSWGIRHRLFSLGVDAPLAGRIQASNGAIRSVGLIADFQGSTILAMLPGGVPDGSNAFCSKDAFGWVEPGACAGKSGAQSTESGYTGAVTPNASGGFVYLRNRWYDPNTGRFLTQDPIGLMGGVNLYAYAGNNPVSYSDPFGLCDPPRTHCPTTYLRVEGSFGKLGYKANVPLLGRLEATIAPVGQVKAGFSVTSDGIDFSGPTYEGGVQVAVSADVGPLEAKVEGEALLTTDMPTTNLAASLGTDAANVQAGDDGIQVGVGVPGGDVGIGANPIAAMSDAFHALTQAISNLSDRLAGIVGATDFGQGLVEMGSGGNPFR